MHNDEQHEPPERLDFSAFQKFDYKQIIYTTPQYQSWRDLSDSFFQASLLLVEKVITRELYDDVEGLAAIFLFRHYLELALKRLVLDGRYLIAEGQNAKRGEVEEVKKIHQLTVLWEWVLKDAKPKVEPGVWDDCDTGFVEKCLREFDAVHAKGFAFRYPGQGGEFCLFEFHQLWYAMQHIKDVLGGLISYLEETYAQNADYEAYLEQEYGSDMY